ncbi:hypothetical protein [Ancylothrix sp. D3o]|nr:hypothetical protein [Ancylothrix sp. D3o]
MMICWEEIKEVNVVLLLCGGDKSTPEEDIRLAIEYWKNYRI